MPPAGDLGFPGLFLLLLLFPVITYVIRWKWLKSQRRAAEIKRKIALASQETARAELAAVFQYSTSFPTTATATAFQAPKVVFAPAVDSEVPPPEKHRCVVCYTPTTGRCSRCKAVRYCSSKCQINHWREGHKDECRPPADAASNNLFASSVPNLDPVSAGSLIPKESDVDKEDGLQPSVVIKRPSNFGSSRENTHPSGPAEATPHLQSAANAGAKNSFHSSSLSSTHHNLVSAATSSLVESSLPFFTHPQERVGPGVSEGQVDVPKVTISSQVDKPGILETALSRNKSPTYLGDEFVAGSAFNQSRIDVNTNSNPSSRVSSKLSGTPSFIHSNKGGSTIGVPVPPKMLVASNQQPSSKDDAVQSLSVSDIRSSKLMKTSLNSSVATHGMPPVDQHYVAQQNDSATPSAALNSSVETSAAASSFNAGLVRKGVSKVSKRKPVAHGNPKKIIFSYEEFVKLYNWDEFELRPCGFSNIGNSCYANVVLQCLVFTRPLTAYFLQGMHSMRCKGESWCFTCEFEKLILQLKEARGSLSPKGVLSHIRSIGSNLVPGKEEDAHEFLRYAVDKMQSLCLEEGGVRFPSPSQEATTLVQLTFGGYLCSMITCLHCKGMSERHDRMMDLTVEIDGNISTLEQALWQFTAAETLDGDNKYFCDRCKSFQKARKKLTIYEAPNILTIALKRFQSGKFGKLNKPVQFPEDLNLEYYMTNRSDQSPIYKLYAVVVHLDIANASYTGHYVCYVKNTLGRWYKIDDNQVESVEIEKVFSKGAYMLLYSRCTPRPPDIIGYGVTDDKYRAISGNDVANEALLNRSKSVSHERSSPRTSFDSSNRQARRWQDYNGGMSPDHPLRSDSPDHPLRLESCNGFDVRSINRAMNPDSSDSSSLFSNSDSCSTESTRDSTSTDEFGDSGSLNWSSNSPARGGSGDSGSPSTANSPDNESQERDYSSRNFGSPNGKSKLGVINYGSRGPGDDVGGRIRRTEFLDGEKGPPFLNSNPTNLHSEDVDISGSGETVPYVRDEKQGVMLRRPKERTHTFL